MKSNLKKDSDAMLALRRKAKVMEFIFILISMIVLIGVFSLAYLASEWISEGGVLKLFCGCGP